MIRSGGEVTIDDTDEGVVIAVKPVWKPWQRAAIVVWIVVWVLCGLIALYGMMAEGNRDTWLVLITFAIFWVYFLYHALRAWVWQRYGREYIRVGNETLDYKRSWGGYGKVVSYYYDNIKELQMIVANTRSFSQAYQETFWTIGGERIGFRYFGKPVAMAMKISETDARKTLRLIESALRKHRKNRSITV
ncbi:MAG: hypothetical protein Kow0075_02270 [Salibacteraceae bacterium]